jgi:hypothetical protein
VVVKVRGSVSYRPVLSLCQELGATQAADDDQGCEDVCHHGTAQMMSLTQVHSSVQPCTCVCAADAPVG